MSFAWLFAIIVGGFILFLAIYATTKIVNIGEYEMSAETQKEIGVLLNPLETGVESGKVTSMSIKGDTRIYTQCSNTSLFGKQIIKISQKSFGQWTETLEGASFKNKYIFSEDFAEGKKFYIFSKPFEFPFKVTDLIYLGSASQTYCFLDAPDNIENEIKLLELQNVNLENCSNKDAKVCFGSVSENCDIEVNYPGKFVKKDKEKMYFEGDTLMYAAVFSTPEVYECQVERLMKRASQLALLYRDKANFVAREGCSSSLNSELLQLSNLAKSVESSSDLIGIANIVEKIKEKNEDAYCKLW